MRLYCTGFCDGIWHHWLICCAKAIQRWSGQFVQRNYELVSFPQGYYLLVYCITFSLGATYLLSAIVFSVYKRMCMDFIANVVSISLYLPFPQFLSSSPSSFLLSFLFLPRISGCSWVSGCAGMYDILVGVLLFPLLSPHHHWWHHHQWSYRHGNSMTITNHPCSLLNMLILSMHTA